MTLKDRYTTAFLLANAIVHDTEQFKKLKLAIWFNPRPTDRSYRLTNYGLDLIISGEINTFKVKFPEEFDLTPQVLIWLDKYLDSPYYVNRKFIIVLTELAAFELYLYSGDIKKFGHSRALSRALDQK